MIQVREYTLRIQVGPIQNALERNVSVAERENMLDLCKINVIKSSSETYSHWLCYLDKESLLQK